MEGILFRPGGTGGSGGYAESTIDISGVLDFYVGAGGEANCDLGGDSLAPIDLQGGDGGSGDGADGGDNIVRGGGLGASPSSAALGGDGFYGGGGGGICLGTTTNQGSSGTPYDAAAIPSSQAKGGSGNCGSGGDGYAILTFSE
jgi:hypothetical protein